LWLILLVPAGFVAGIINVLAGGGSFLTLPMLIAAGLPVHVANGTNRVAVALQAVVATAIYRKEDQFDGQLYRHLLPPLLLGALTGATLATVIDPERLRSVFGVLFLVMGLFLLARQTRRREQPSAETRPRLGALGRFFAFLLVGVYGGFLQAGVGLWILLCSTSLLGVDALRANSVKLPLVMTFTLPAIAIFLYADQIRVVPGLLLGLGNVLGTFVGVRLSLKGGAALIFRAVTLVLLITGLYLLLG
jgi:hypothetical protein